MNRRILFVLPCAHCVRSTIAGNAGDVEAEMEPQSEFTVKNLIANVEGS